MLRVELGMFGIPMACGQAQTHLPSTAVPWEGGKEQAQESSWEGAWGLLNFGEVPEEPQRDWGC